MPKIRVTTTITTTEEVPYDSDHYADLSLADAVLDEQNLDFQAVVESFVQTLEFSETPPNFTRTVEIVEEDNGIVDIDDLVTVEPEAELQEVLSNIDKAFESEAVRLAAAPFSLEQIKDHARKDFQRKHNQSDENTQPDNEIVAARIDAFVRDPSTGVRRTRPPVDPNLLTKYTAK